jgi:glycosyltransferase involved in cell wall biosynthesis
MNSATPLVTVGIPVYNGERYLGRAIESLLAQTLENFELLIADNASTDGTQKLCESYGRRDSRIKYVRHRHNIGAPRNWNCLIGMTRARYFKWSTANDRSMPHMLQSCVDVMEADPGVVLCYGHTLLMDENEQPLEVFKGDMDVPMPHPSARFAAVCEGMTLNNAMCGVIRTEVLKRTALDRLYPSGDMALMSELALYGRFRLLPEVLFERRQSPGTFTSMLTPLQIQRVYDPDARMPMKLLRGRRHWDNFVCIARAPIPWSEKLRAFRTASRLVAWDRCALAKEFRALLSRETSAR